MTDDSSTVETLRSLAEIAVKAEKSSVQLAIEPEFLLRVASELEHAQVKLDNLEAEIARLERLASY